MSIQSSAARTCGSSRLTSASVSGPALVLVDQDDEQGRRVGRTVVRRVGLLLEAGGLAVPQLVQDLAGFLVAEVVHPVPLQAGQHQQGRRDQLRQERQHLQRGDDAVPAEQGHEPRQPGGDQPYAQGDRLVAQRRQVVEAAPVRPGQRLAVAAEFRRPVDQFLVLGADGVPAAAAGVRQGGSDVLAPRPVDDRGHVQSGGPLAVAGRSGSGRSFRRCRPAPARWSGSSVSRWNASRR